MTIPSAWISPLLHLFRSSFKTQVGTEFTRHRNLGFHSWRLGKVNHAAKLWHSTITKKKERNSWVMGYSKEQVAALHNDSEYSWIFICIIHVPNPKIISHTSWPSPRSFSVFSPPPAPASATHPHSWLLESASDWPLRMLGHPNDWIKPAAWCKVPAGLSGSMPKNELKGLDGSWEKRRESCHLNVSRQHVLLAEILRTRWFADACS